MKKSKLRMEKVIVIGASSGTGAAIAKQLAAEGAQVAILGRRIDNLNWVAAAKHTHLHPYVHDVTKPETVAPLFERIINDLGGLDTVIYAAGTMPPVGENEFNVEQDIKTFKVNLLGAIAWLNLAAARFQVARAGTIIGISSVAGERARRINPIYGASKAGLTAYLEGLRNKLARYGVNVVTVKPGLVDTALNKQTGRTFWIIYAEEAARLSLRLARKNKGVSGFVPRRWAVVALLMRCLPSWIFRRINF